MAMQTTMIHLDPQQKAELKRRAKAAGRSMAEEVRRAIDIALVASELTPTELEVLDHLTRRAQENIAAMRADVREMIDRLDSTFAKINAIRRKSGRRPL